jgi:hypothetical protein
MGTKVHSKEKNNMKGRLFLWWLLASVVFAWVTPSATGQTLMDAGRRFLAGSPFPIKESGYWTCSMGIRECVYWLDNERVIFNGTNPAEFENGADGQRTWKKQGIFIWNLKTNAITKHADAYAERGSLCVDGGYIRYNRLDGEEVVTLAGTLGKEVEIARRGKGEYPKEDPKLHGWNTWLSCGRYLPNGAPPMLGGKVALKDGDGFLYFGTMNDRALVQYFRHGSLVGTELPVERWKVMSTSVMRTEFDDSYVFFGPYRESEKRGTSSCMPKPTERHLYRLTPSTGTFSTISIPALPEFRCNVYRYAIVRNGVVIQTGAGHATNLDLSVSYLLRHGKVVEAIVGVVNEQAVSPNGCLLALGISSDRDKRKPVGAFHRGHLKVIDFCAKGAS